MVGGAWDVPAGHPLPEVAPVTDENGALFALPAGARTWTKPARLPAGIRYTRYRPRTHTLCDDCVLCIHQLGVEVAAFPRTVRWKRTDESGRIVLVCEIHRAARIEAGG